MADTVTPGAPPICTRCTTLVMDEYYTEQGRMLCPACGTRRPQGPRGLFIRALGFGLVGAGIAVLVLYGLVSILSFTSAWLVIFAGIVVGSWVRKGARKLGGRRFQILAAVLTYVSGLTIYVRLVDACSPGQRWRILAMPVQVLSEGGSFGLVTLAGFVVAMFIAWKLNRLPPTGRLGPFRLPPTPADFDSET